MEALNAYLANHHGVITKGQAVQRGLTVSQIRRRIRTGEFIRVGPKVYRLATAPDTWEARARAFALSARGLVSFTSGLRGLGVEGEEDHVDIHIIVDERRRPRTAGATVHRAPRSEIGNGRLVNGIPVASPVRVLIDCASLLQPDDLDLVIDAMIRQRLLTITEVRARVAALGTEGRSGLGVLRRLIERRDPSARVPDSRFNRLVGQLLVSGGQPPPTYEYEVAFDGEFVGRVDLAYPSRRLLIELDSARWHYNRRSFVNDPRRKNRLLIAGYRVLTFTWDDYTNAPESIIAAVAAALDHGLDANASL